MVGMICIILHVNCIYGDPLLLSNNKQQRTTKKYIDSNVQCGLFNGPRSHPDTEDPIGHSHGQCRYCLFARNKCTMGIPTPLYQLSPFLFSSSSPSSCQWFGNPIQISNSIPSCHGFFQKYSWFRIPCSLCHTPNSK